ncbi:MAG: serine/threonine protein phosphatase [Erysipelotrichales bacterium]|nr:serine/threonine protein phosphatase [Erysipelotrichales bacterium]
MATYVMSDIHGQYDMFIELLEKIDLKDQDTLYILGDIVDRGPNPMKVLFKMMGMSNVVPLAGNHELMALECLEYLCDDITEEFMNNLDEDRLEIFDSWIENGGLSTIKEFLELSKQKRTEIIDYISEFGIYEELSINNEKYFLVHAGLGIAVPSKNFDDYSIKELLWDRMDYEMQYFDDMYIVSGHTPTQTIYCNPKPGYIFQKNKHIAIDCGSYSLNGRLAAICLETKEEYYVDVG